MPFDTYGNYLTREDAEKGKNFYDGFGIFNAVKEYRKYNKPLYSNLLRSEHIPFNIFIPLNNDRKYAKEIFADILKMGITSIDKIKIEYAPKPKENYLNDGTSFDTYVEYTDAKGYKGIIGIEVKYTEKEYKLRSESKEKNDICDNNSPYFSVTQKCGLYKPMSINILTTDKYRQIWRNHLLGESILLTDCNKFKHFTSLTLFPASNTHFIETSKKYVDLLIKNENAFIAITYEELFSVMRKYCPDSNYANWLNYLNTRYIVPAE